MNKEKTSRILFITKVSTLFVCMLVALGFGWFRVSLEDWVYCTAQFTTLTVYLNVHYILPRIIYKSVSSK